MLYDGAMKGAGYIVDFNQSDGLPPLVVQKLNNNFRAAAGVDTRPIGSSGGGSTPSPGTTDYEDLTGKPSINGVTLEGNLTSADLGLGYDPDAVVNITRTGTTFTATRYDGTTFTFDQQDMDSWPSALAADVVSKLGNTPVNRATADAAGNDIQATYATKSEIAGIYRYKGSVADETLLPSSGQSVGDVYNIEAASSYGAAGANVAWNGTGWDPLGEVFSIDSITNAEIDAIVV